MRSKHPLLKRLARVTSTRMYVPEIDGLRFLSILSVVLFHLRTAVLESGQFSGDSYTGNLVFYVLSRGGLGVNIFFTISGFILALPLIGAYLMKKRRFNVGKFYLRRVTRLEPPYIIIMTVFFIGQLLFFDWAFETHAPHYLASLAYAHFFVYDAWSTVNPVAWSLETEVQFYLLAPFLGYIFLIKKTRLRVAVATGILILHLLVLPAMQDQLHAAHLSKSVLVYFSNFWLGFILADIFAHSGIILGQSDNGTRSVLADILGLLGLVGIFYFYYHKSVFAPTGFLASVACLFYSAFRGRIANRVFTNAWITSIGGMCYTIYLVHYIFLFLAVPLLNEVLTGMSFFAYFFSAALVFLPVLLVLSMVTFLLFEKPFMDPDWTRQVGMRIKRIFGSPVA